jgi:twitching motility protein PilT
MTGGMSSMIRDGKTSQLTSAIQMGKGMGMQAMDDALWDLLLEDVITPEATYEKAVDKKNMRSRLEKGGFQGDFEEDE